MSTDNLRDGWTVRSLESIAEEVIRRVSDPRTSGLDRFVSSSCIDRHDVRVTRWEATSEVVSAAKRFEPGDYLLVRRSLYATDFRERAPQADFAGVCSADILTIRERDGEVAPGFLQYLLYDRGLWDFIVANSTGSITRRIKWKQIAKYEFALPPIGEQARIAELMSAADSCIHDLSFVGARVNGLIDALAGELDTLAVSYATLAEVADVTVGIVVKPADLYVPDGGIPALRSLNVSPGRLVWDEVVSISSEGHHAHTKSRLATGDVVIVRSGRPGDAAVIPDGLGELNAIDLLIARCRTGSGISPDILVTYLNSSRGRAQMLGRSAGTAQQHLNAGQLKQVRIPLLPLFEQQRIREQVDTANLVRRVALDELATVRDLRSSLLAECLKGSVDVQ